MAKASDKQLTALTADQAVGCVSQIMDLQHQYTSDLAKAATAVQRSLVQAAGQINFMNLMAGDAAMLKTLDSLQGTASGFTTDKKYAAQDLCEPVVQALMAEALLTGNEFTLIKGRCYLAKNYYARKLHECPDVTDFRPPVIYRPERIGNSTLVFGGIVSCKYQGHYVEERAEISAYGDSRIEVTAYEGDIDQGHGKAEKRLLQRLWNRISSGVPITESDEQTEATIVSEIVPASMLKPIVKGSVFHTGWQETFRKCVPRVQEYGRQVFEAFKDWELEAIINRANADEGLNSDEQKLIKEFADGRLKYYGTEEPRSERVPDAGAGVA